MQDYLIGEYVQPRTFTKLEEIAEHNQAGDLWLLIHNKVYDVSSFKHPGKSLKLNIMVVILYSHSFSNLLLL
jgi:hypothetical protein